MALLDTPQRSQKAEHDCGATAFEILFRYHYPNRPMPEWGDLADPVRGLSPDALELFVRKEFPNRMVGHLGLKELRFLAAFTPVLCLITPASKIDHWVVVRGVTTIFVHTQDPDCGRKSYTHGQWLEVWRDDLNGPYQRFAIAGWPG